jgi:hypothetical protein
MTAEIKKGKYVYYRCTGFKGRCGNAYIREEGLAELMSAVVTPIQITPDIAEGISAAISASGAEVEQKRRESMTQLEQRRRVVVSKMDRAYEDLVPGRVSDEFWSRKSSASEAELQTVEREISRVKHPTDSPVINVEKILELAKKAEFLYKSQNPTEQRRLLETVLSNCTFDRGSLVPTYSKPFDLLVRGNETGCWRRGWDSFPTIRGRSMI